MEALRIRKEKSKVNYERNKEKMRLRDQTRRNDPVQYALMKERSKLCNRKRYQEMKDENYVCDCGAHIKRVSLHTHLTSQKHLNGIAALVNPTT